MRPRAAALCSIVVIVSEDGPSIEKWGKSFTVARKAREEGPKGYVSSCAEGKRGVESCEEEKGPLIEEYCSMLRYG